MEFANVAKLKANWKSPQPPIDSRRLGEKRDTLTTALRLGPKDHGRAITDEELAIAEYRLGP